MELYFSVPLLTSVSITWCVAASGYYYIWIVFNIITEITIEKINIKVTNDTVTLLFLLNSSSSIHTHRLCQFHLQKCIFICTNASVSNCKVTKPTVHIAMPMASSKSIDNCNEFFSELVSGVDVFTQKFDKTVSSPKDIVQID